MRLLLPLILLAITSSAQAQPAPKEPSPVVELIEDNAETLARLFNNDGGLDATKLDPEWRDVFTGASSVRVTTFQRFSARMPNWNFPIVEKPGPGQYRYLRFAWKRTETAAIMIQLHNANGVWNQRYLAGTASPNVQGWGPMLGIAARAPVDWDVVTRDLFKDFGAMTITGLALTPMEGPGVGLFDHFFLGRTVEDLDQVTDLARGKKALDKALAVEQLTKLWEDLGSRDAAVVSPALRTLAAGRKESVPFLAERLKKFAAPQAKDQNVEKLLADLDDEEFKVREAAFRELKKLGAGAVPRMRQVFQETRSTEVRRRLEILLEKHLVQDSSLSQDQLRVVRAIRILEYAGTAEARRLLEELSQATLEAGMTDDVRRALKRLK